jgi:hypothetical protein
MFSLFETKYIKPILNIFPLAIITNVQNKGMDIGGFFESINKNKLFLTNDIKIIYKFYVTSSIQFRIK